VIDKKSRVSDLKIELGESITELLISKGSLKERYNKKAIIELIRKDGHLIPSKYIVTDVL